VVVLWFFAAALPLQNTTNISLYTADEYFADFREIHPMIV
jgi:hypothetical protein